MSFMHHDSYEIWSNKHGLTNKQCKYDMNAIQFNNFYHESIFTVTSSFHYDKIYNKEFNNICLDAGSLFFLSFSAVFV